MHKTFTIEWPDDLGEGWMNVWSLTQVLIDACPNTEFSVSDENARCGGGPANPYRDSKRRSDLIGAIARGWCHPSTSKKVMDSDLVMAIYEEVCKLWNLSPSIPRTSLL